MLLPPDGNGIIKAEAQTGISCVPAIICQVGNYGAKAKCRLITNFHTEFHLTEGDLLLTQASSCSFLIVSMCFAGFRPLGQACVQFLMVWQR